MAENYVQSSGQEEEKKKSGALSAGFPLSFSAQSISGRGMFESCSAQSSATCQILQSFPAPSISTSWILQGPSNPHHYFQAFSADGNREIACRSFAVKGHQELSHFGAWRAQQTGNGQACREGDKEQ